MNMMKIGIESGAYLSRYGLEEGLKRMRKHGYECVDFQDFANTEGPLFQLDEAGFEKELKNIKKQISKLKLAFYPRFLSKVFCHI